MKLERIVKGVGGRKEEGINRNVRDTELLLQMVVFFLNHWFLAYFIMYV